LIGIHFVGLPAIGALLSVPAALAALFVSATLELIKVVLPTIMLLEVSVLETVKLPLM